VSASSQVSGSSPAVRSATGADLQPGIRRHITVMFTDVVGFTAMSEQIGEEAVFDLVRRIAAEQAESIRAHGGVLQDFAGDGIMAVFGAPVALEDACLRACRTAADIQLRMGRLEPEFMQTYGVRPQLRIGIHTGAAVVGQVGQDSALAYNALGDNVNVAARIQAAADPGTIFLSRSSLDVVEGFVDATAMGERALKGKAEGLALFRLDAVHGGVTRFGAKLRRGLAPLQEREHELTLLRARWADVRRGTAQVVDIVGEAGIGKSRLLFEFDATLHGEDAVVLAAACRPESAATPFFPLIEVIRRWLDLAESAPRAVAAQALGDALGALGANADKLQPYLLDLLTGPDPGVAPTALPASELVGVRTREALIELILAWGLRASPTVLVVEDLHWIDTASQEVLAAAVDALSDERLLVLCSYRPNYRASRSGRAAVVRLPLERLSNESAATLLRSRLAGSALADELISVAVAKAEGNPLFAEEIATYLAERAIRLSGKPQSEAIPSSLENLIMDRVHRLDPEAIALLQSASVVGRTFPVELVSDVSGLNGKVPSLLRSLEQNDIVFPVEQDHVGPAAEYSFKHVLVQDALYASLLSGARAAVHEKAGLYLEETAGDRASEIADLLAHHFSRTKRSDRAVRYLALAAEKNLRLFSLTETLAQLDQALALIAKQPACADDALVADILVNRLMVCCWEADFASMVRLGQQYMPRVERLGPSRQLSRVLAWMGEGYLNSERFEDAERMLERALAIGEAIGSEESIAYALWDIMWLHLLSPDGRPRERYAEMGHRIFAAAERLDDPYLETLTYYTFSADALQRGFLGEAQDWADRSIALGQRTGYPPAVSLGWLCSSFVAAAAGNGAAALEQAQKAHDASAGRTERVCALGGRGLAELVAGRPSESLATFREFHRQVEEAGFLALLVASEVPQAAARAFSGDPAGAIADLEAAIVRFKRWRNSRIVTWAHLVLGQIHLAAVPPDKPSIGSWLTALSKARSRRRSIAVAEHHLAEAAAIARTAGTKGFLLQALTALADAGLGAFHGPSRRAALAQARAVAEEIGAAPVLEHLDTLLSRT
jgi:class 3 adenylate cyclase/tetratricopeptide (TPR) repeat protein